MTENKLKKKKKIETKTIVKTNYQHSEAVAQVCSVKIGILKNFASNFG